MKKYQNVASFFAQKGPADIERFVDKNLDISQQVYSILKEKGWTQKDFASKLGKSDAEISKWLSGTHNLTLRSIAKMEAVLEKDIILTPQKAKEKYSQVEHITVEKYARVNQIITRQSIGFNPAFSSLENSQEETISYQAAGNYQYAMAS